MTTIPGPPTSGDLHLVSSNVGGKSHSDAHSLLNAAATNQSYGFTIYSTGGGAAARNGSTGTVDYSGGDAAAVLQSCLTALASTGGSIVFATGVYTWSSVPKLPRNTSEWISIRGEGDVVITLSSSGRRFLDFDRQAADDVFNFFCIEGFTVDDSASSALTGKHHVVLGTFQAGSTITGQDCNFDHIIIRRIRTIGVRTAAVTTAQNMNIWIAIHATNGSTQYYLTNILVEQCEFDGGAYGVGLYGTTQTGFGGTPDIWMDNIIVRDVVHDTNTAPTGFDNFANVHLGSKARGGRCWVERCVGKNSWDVGIEIDNFQRAYVNDCHLEDWYGFGLAITNYTAPLNVNDQAYFVSGVSGRREFGAWAQDSTALIGAVPSAGGAFGRIICDRISYYRKGSQLDDGKTSGDMVELKIPAIEFSMDHSWYYAEGMQHGSETGNTHRVIYTAQTSGTNLIRIKNTDIRMEGTFDVSSPELDMTAVFISGATCVLDIDSVTVDYNVTNTTGPAQIGIAIGQPGTTTAYGLIRGVRVSTAAGSSSRGIIIYDSSKLTIPSNRQIRIANCDFSGMNAGTEILWVTDTSTKIATFVSGITWRTFPAAAYAITAPASNTGTRYTDAWDGSMYIHGGTVTLIEMSKDNSTYYTVATATNVVVPIHHTEYYRITYSSTPAIHIFPEIK